MESKEQLSEQYGFVIAPLIPPHIPDVILCSLDTRTPLVSIIAALNSELTPVSARNLSRWLFLLARHSTGARPIRPPAVYRPITVVGADVFVRCIDEIGPETFPCDSSDPLPPGCYALFGPNGKPYTYPFGHTTPRPTFTKTHPIWDVPDDDPRASYRMTRHVPEFLASKARERDRGLCCFTGHPSECITWVIPPLLSWAATTPGFSFERCLSPDNVFTISPELLSAYHDNGITVDPQDGYRIIAFEGFPNTPLLDRFGSLPASGRFWHSSLSWTLAVRLAGCDARFDGVSAIKARDLLEELTFDLNRSIPQTSEWLTITAQEAVRALLWARVSAQASVWDVCEPSLPSPSHSSIYISSDRADPFIDCAEPPAHRRQSSLPTNFFWFVIHSWWNFIYYIWTQLGAPRRRSVD